MKEMKSGVYSLSTLYHNAGKDHAVLFVHGFALDKHDFDGIFDKIASRLQELDISTLQYDLPGMGKSFGELATIPAQHLMDSVTNLCTWLQERHEKVSIIAASFGAVLTLATMPLAINSLVLLNPPAYTKETWTRVLDMAAGKGWITQYEENDVVVLKSGLRINSKMIGNTLNLPFLEYAAALEVPTLHVQGTKDRWVTMEDAKTLHDAIGAPKKEFLVIEGSPHGFVGEPFQKQAIEGILKWFSLQITS